MIVVSSWLGFHFYPDDSNYTEKAYSDRHNATQIEAGLLPDSHLE